jgi:hypothetical protein
MFLTAPLVFVGMIELLHIPNIFSFCAGFEVIHIMPDVVDSSYVNVDPCIRVLYYQALYYGLYKLHGPGNKLAQAAYYKVLESVPVWLAGATGTVLDVCNAILVVRCPPQALVQVLIFVDLDDNQQLRLPTLLEISLQSLPISTHEKHRQT